MIVSRSKYLLLRGILYHEFDINNCLVSITDETISRQRCVAFEHEKILMETVNTQRRRMLHTFIFSEGKHASHGAKNTSSIIILFVAKHNASRKKWSKNIFWRQAISVMHDHVNCGRSCARN